MAILSGAVAFGDTYTAWPNSCLYQADSTIFQVYTDGTTHTADDKIVYIRTFGESWSSATVVADRTSAGLGATCHGARVTADGTHLALVRYTDDDGATVDSYYVHTSSDGSTWSAGSQLQTTGPADYSPFDAGGVFLTSEGTFLSYTRDQSQNSFIIRNEAEDGSGVWEKIAISGGTMNLEGSFVELPDGTIICLVRTGGAPPPYSTQVGARITISNDDGTTWSPLVFASLPSMTASPCAMVYLASLDAVEVWAGDRFATGGVPSIWRFCVPSERAKAGAFGEPLDRIPGQAAITGPDFGYPAALDAGEQRLVTWYDGDSTSTDIWYLEFDGETVDDEWAQRCADLA